MKVLYFVISAVRHARSGADAAGVAEYYCHVQTGLSRTGSCSKQGESDDDIWFVPCTDSHDCFTVVQLLKLELDL